MGYREALSCYLRRRRLRALLHYQRARFFAVVITQYRVGDHVGKRILFCRAGY